MVDKKMTKKMKDCDNAEYGEKVIDFLENQEDYRMTPQDREMIMAHGYELYKVMQKGWHPRG